MKDMTTHLLRIVFITALYTAGTASAHGGEDHGAPSAVASQTTLPRAIASTDDFEVVAVLEGNRLLIHVDRTASNQPVTQARVEVDGTGPNVVASEFSPGAYAVDLAQAPVAGSHALTFTIQTADTGDLLTATLDVPAGDRTLTDATQSAPSMSFMKTLADRDWRWLAGGTGLLSAAFALAVVRRRRTAPRH